MKFDRFLHWGKDKIKIFAINVEKINKKKTDKFFTDLKIKNFSTFYDPDYLLASKIGLRGLPTTLIIDRNGKEIARVIGSIDFADENFINWLNLQNNYTYKVFIAGNHDITFESEKMFREKGMYFDGATYDNEAVDGKPEWLTDLLGTGLGPNTFYLENSFVEIDQIKIWGSPVTPNFGYGWAFNKARGNDINQVWNNIPDDTDMVIKLY